MQKIFLFFLPLLLSAEHLYETRLSDANKKAMENQKIKCRTICDQKLYREQKIAEAVSFYKNSKFYKFNKNDSDFIKGTSK